MFSHERSVNRTLRMAWGPDHEKGTLLTTLVFTAIAAAISINLSGRAADAVQEEVHSAHFLPIQETSVR